MSKIYRIDLNSSEYPKRLLDVLGRESPKLLYCQGNLDLLFSVGVGFCGSRKASDRAIEATRECSSLVLKSGLTVISGNAPGVDYNAHLEALQSSGNTIFVLPEGINRFRIRKAFRDFWSWEKCLVLSQFHPDATWRNYQAMQRNNTIIGLSSAMIVMEAGISGGTRHAGENALHYGVPLFVVEYRDLYEHSEGNKWLINQGGIPVRRSARTGAPNVTKIVEAARFEFNKEKKQKDFDFD